MSARGGEFDFIARYLKPLATDSGAQGLGDDVALIDPDWVISKDMLVAGVHFRPDDPADLVARKALRVNLSDLAGKGVKPFGYFLGCAFSPDCNERWRGEFVGGLAVDQQEFDVSLLGGDTVSTTGPVTISVTVLGRAPTKLPRRKDAEIGDDVWVSGTLGDSALGLDEAADVYLQQRYLLPQPRVSLGLSLRGLVNASMDISDGLLADAGHMAESSGKQLAINLDALPLSAAARAAVNSNPALWQAIVAGGDDYEILFTASAQNAEKVGQAGKATGIPVTPIGKVVAGEGVELTGHPLQYVNPARKGFQHF